MPTVPAVTPLSFAMVSRPLDPVRGHSLPEVSPPPASRAAAAAFSPCGRYRWWLQRTWQSELPTLLFVGLNPSRADGQRDDPTLRRLVAYGRRWGFGRLEVLNLFGLVARAPAALRRASDPVGSENEGWIRRRLSAPIRWCSGPIAPSDQHQCLADRPHCALLWLGWGNGGAWQGRDRWMLDLLARLDLSPMALDRTAAGQPRHPLYASASMTLAPYAPSWWEFGGPEPFAHGPHPSPFSHSPVA